MTSRKFLFLLLLIPSLLFALDDLPLLEFAEDDNTAEPIVTEQTPDDNVELQEPIDLFGEESATTEQPEKQVSEALDSLPLLELPEPKDSLLPLDSLSLLDLDTSLVDMVGKQDFINKVVDFKNDPSISPEPKIRLLQYKAYGSFNENPATIASRDVFYFDIPFGFTFTFRNSNLSWNDFVTMFQEDNMLSTADKEKIYGNDWDISLGLSKPIFGLGYDNYQFASNIIVNAKIKNLGAQWLKFVLEGNGKDRQMLIEESSGEGSEAIAYVKNSLTYAIPSAFVFFERDFYFGLNLNIYNAVGYAKVENSKQTADLENGKAVVEYDYLYSKFDKIGVNSSMGFGFGMVVDALPDIYFLKKGRAYLSVDDLFAKLKFSGMEKTTYSKTITYSYKDSESNDTVTVDTTYDLDDYTVKLDPEYSLGVSYSLFDETSFGSMRFVTKYRKATFAYDKGFSLGFDYYPFEHLPINFRYGLDEDSYFSFVVGLDWYVDFAVRFVNYGHTLGGGAKGFTIGLDMLRIKF